MEFMLYEIEDLRFSYDLGKQRIEALRGVGLSIAPGTFLCLSGPSGSGKSTLLNILGLIESLDRTHSGGSVRFEGRSLATLTEAEKANLRRFKIGFIFQQFHLFPTLTAQENVELFLARQGVSSAERGKRARAALESVGLAAHVSHRPLQMSGGQQQRVAIARALAKSPKVIIADEPTASLDQKTGAEIMKLMRSECEKRGVTVIVSSHDPMVTQFATQLVHLTDGQIQAETQH